MLSLCHCLSSYHHARPRESGFAVSTPSHWGLVDSNKIPSYPSLLRLNKPSFISLYLYILFSSTLIVLKAFLWPCSTMSMFSFYWGENWTQWFRNAEWKRIITSLELLAIIFPVQLSMWWLSSPQGHTVDPCSSCLQGCSGPFLQSCFLFVQWPSFNAGWGYSIPNAELHKCLC